MSGPTALLGPQQVPGSATGPLTGVRVVDLSRTWGRYCAHLLAGLGATVVRTAPADATTVSAGGAVWSGASNVNLDLDDADILLTDAGPADLRAQGLDPELTTARPGLVHVSITPHGLTGPRADMPGTDLTVLAAGGLLYLCGDPDRPPVRPYGEQSVVAAGLHATVAALMALLVAEQGRGGQLVDVSAQEAVAHSLENAVQYLDCEGVVRRRAGAGPTEAGVGIYRCSDGYVYLLTTMGGADLSWTATVEWLVESGVPGASELAAAEWQVSDHRRLLQSTRIFRELFERFGESQTMAELYSEGQRRGISLAPVNAPRDLLKHEHLIARGFFRECVVDGVQVQVPGPPFNFRPTPVDPGHREVTNGC